MPEIIPQIIGLLAVATFLLSYQMKKRRNIIIVNVISRLLYIVQYVLLGAFSGAILDSVGIIASVIAEKKNTPFIKKHTTVIVVTCGLVVLSAGLAIAFVNRSVLDLLPIIGVFLHTGAFWLTDERIIRRVSLAGSPFWLVYNFLSHAYGSAVGDVLTMVSIITAMIKYKDFKRTGEKYEN